MSPHPPDIDLLELILRLAAAAFSGAVLGMHAALRKRPGGLRTSILTAVGAALFCVTAVRAAPGSESVLRAIQGIASGVGFIGGSVVLREGTTVRGVANGAAIWIAAATGSAAGFGDWQLATYGSVFVALISQAAYHAEHSLISKLQRDRGEHKNKPGP